MRAVPCSTASPSDDDLGIVRGLVGIGDAPVTWASSPAFRASQPGHEADATTDAGRLWRASGGPAMRRRATTRPGTRRARSCGARPSRGAGETADELALTFLSADEVLPHMRPGVTFTLWEGKTIGRGTVLRVEDG
jgi:hypothetical protein